MQPQLGVRLRLLRAASARFVSHHVRRVLAATDQLAGYRVGRRGTYPYSSFAYHFQQLRTLSSELCARAPYERTDSSCAVRTVPCVAIVCTVWYACLCGVACHCCRIVATYNTHTVARIDADSSVSLCWCSEYHRMARLSHPPRVIVHGVCAPA